MHSTLSIAIFRQIVRKKLERNCTPFKLLNIEWAKNGVKETGKLEEHAPVPLKGDSLSPHQESAITIALK